MPSLRMGQRKRAPRLQPNQPLIGVLISLARYVRISFSNSLSSIPRPEVVRRVRTEPRGDTPGRSTVNGNDVDSRSQPMDVDTPAASSSKQDEVAEGGRSRLDAPISSLHKSALLQSRDSTSPIPIPINMNPPPGKQRPHSPRGHRIVDERMSRSDAAPMPPPIAPSQTLSAQELRETARQSIRRSDEQADARVIAVENNNSRGESRMNSPPGSRRRSQSPPTRPGTRNASTESRTSGERLVDRGGGDVDRVDDRRLLERESSSRQDAYTSERREHRRDRSERERSERGRDRHGDRERDREHRGERERDPERERERRDRDRDRDRERDRDRDRERGDRHRRDEKDRDRESRKERETSGRTVLPVEDRGQSARPGHRSAAPTDDTLGKRRRLGEDEVRNPAPLSKYKLIVFIMVYSPTAL